VDDRQRHVARFPDFWERDVARAAFDTTQPVGKFGEVTHGHVGAGSAKHSQPTSGCRAQRRLGMFGALKLDSSPCNFAKLPD